MAQKLEIYDLGYNLLCLLNDMSTDSARNIQLEQNLNGVDKLTFDLPINSNKWKYILNENLVRYKNEYYFIKIPKYTDSESQKIINVECEHMSTSLQSKTNPAFTDDVHAITVGQPVGTLMSIVLDGTGWRFGTTDIPSTTTRSLVVSEQSAFTNLVKIAELFNANLFFSSNDMTVSLIKQVNDRNVQIRKGKNLKQVSIQYDTTEIVTRLFAFGGTEPTTGLTINIMGVNPTGKSYVEDYSWYIAQGYSQEYIDAHPELFLHESTWSATDYLDANNLYQDTLTKILKVSKPKVTCEIECLDLSVFPEFVTEPPRLGEIVHIIDDDLELVLGATINKITTDEDLGVNVKIQVSNEIEYNSVMKQLVDTSKVVNQVVDTTNHISGQTITNGTILTDQLGDSIITSAKIQNATIDEAKIKDASITNAKIADASITSAKIGNAEITNAHIKDGEIDSAKIKDASITSAKIGTAEIISAHIKDGEITNAKIANASIDTAKIKDASITSALIQDASIVNSKMGTSSISTANIQDGAIINAKIVNGAIDNAKIQDGAITNAKIANASITTAQIQDAQITTAKIANASIDYTKIANATIQTANIADGQITNAKIANGTIDNAKIADATITNAKIANGEIDTAKIKDASIVNAKIANLAVSTANIQDGAIQTAKIGDAQITNIKIANGSIDNIKIQDASITNAKIANATIDATKIQDATITNAKIANGAIDNAKIANASIDTAKIQTGSITNALIGTGAVNTAQIADGSITDAKIVGLTANKITAGTIDANNVTLVNLKADSIVAGSLTIDGDNLIHNTAWLTDTSTWTLTANVTRDTTTVYDTSNTLKIDVTGQSADLYRSIYSEKISIFSGSLVGSVYVKTPDYTKIDSVGARLFIEWFDASDTRLKQDCQQITFTTNDTWQRVLLSSSSPANAVKVWIRVCLYRNGTLFIARPMLQRGSIASEWKPHTDEQISSGAITTDKIANKAITTITLDDGAVTNTQISANTITGDKLVVDAITAREIASKTITANEIATNTITASEMQTGTITAVSGIIADGAITNAKIQDATIQSAKIASIDAGKITTGTLSAGVIGAGSITIGKLDSTTQNNISAGAVAESNAKSYAESLSKLSTINNATDTLFHFDNNLTATNGIYPNSGYVASLRKTEGKFGGCVAVEEGTTNLITQQDVTLWTKESGATVVDTGTTYQGQKVFKVTFPTGGLPRIYFNFNASGQVFSGNVLVKRDSSTQNNGVNLFFRQQSFGDTYGSKGIMLTDNWQSLNILNTTVPTNSMFLLYQPLSTTPTTVFYICMPQLEQKAFPTSFVNGTRANGNLKYDKNIVNPSSGTINCWVYVNKEGSHSASTTWAMAYSIADSTEYNQISLRKKQNSTDWCVYVCSATKMWSYSFTLNSSGWHMFTITWGINGVNVCLDGALVSSTDNSYNPTTFNNCSGDGFFVGSWLSSNTDYLNSLIDELFISSKQYSSDEIKTIYNMQQPMFDANPKIVIPKPTISSVNFI